MLFGQLDTDESAIWSLLLASGYLKPDAIEYRGELLEPWYHLSITNLETRSMFSTIFKGWFKGAISNYNRFMSAIISGDIEAVNYYMNKVASEIFSFFDVGGKTGESEPERFYHGFVLGLMAEQSESYEIRSNRERGFGRYDAELIARGISKERIKHYGFAFEGKNVLIAQA